MHARPSCVPAAAHTAHDSLCLQAPHRDAQPARRPHQRHAGRGGGVVCVVGALVAGFDQRMPELYPLLHCAPAHPPPLSPPPAPAPPRWRSCGACGASPTTSSCATPCCSPSTAWRRACATLAERYIDTWRDLVAGAQCHRCQVLQTTGRRGLPWLRQRFWSRCRWAPAHCWACPPATCRRGRGIPPLCQSLVRTDCLALDRIIFCVNPTMHCELLFRNH